MCCRKLMMVAALLAVAAGPALADKPSPGKPETPHKIGGKTLEQWIRDIRAPDRGERRRPSGPFPTLASRPGPLPLP